MKSSASAWKDVFYNGQYPFAIFRILKLLNQRKLETLKERWWNQNPQKKVSFLFKLWLNYFLKHCWNRHKNLLISAFPDLWMALKACEEADDNSGGISIHNIGGVFIVIFIGIGLAIVTLAAEYWSLFILIAFPFSLITDIMKFICFFPGTTSIKLHQREWVLLRCTPILSEIQNF